jgi:hypothetical protein
MKTTFEERFEAKVDRTGGPDACHLWTAVKSGHGYGHISVKGKPYAAHRAAWELVNGPIPDGLLVRHSCHNRACVNPEHLSVGTHQDNADDKVRAGRQSRGYKLNGAANGNAKLNEDNIIAIREMRELGWTQKVIADLHGVAQETISHICTGKIWSHVAAS